MYCGFVHFLRGKVGIYPAHIYHVISFRFLNESLYL
jgi:hypothetical protein